MGFYRLLYYRDICRYIRDALLQTTRQGILRSGIIGVCMECDIRKQRNYIFDVVQQDSDGAHANFLSRCELDTLPYHATRTENGFELKEDALNLAVLIPYLPRRSDDLVMILNDGYFSTKHNIFGYITSRMSRSTFILSYMCRKISGLPVKTIISPTDKYFIINGYVMFCKWGMYQSAEYMVCKTCLAKHNLYSSHNIDAGYGKNRMCGYTSIDCSESAIEWLYALQLLWFCKFCNSGLLRTAKNKPLDMDKCSAVVLARSSAYIKYLCGSEEHLGASFKNNGNMLLLNCPADILLYAVLKYNIESSYGVDYDGSNTRNILSNSHILYSTNLVIPELPPNIVRYNDVYVGKINFLIYYCKYMECNYIVGRSEIFPNLSVCVQRSKNIDLIKPVTDIISIFQRFKNNNFIPSQLSHNLLVHVPCIATQCDLGTLITYSLKSPTEYLNRMSNRV